MFSLLSSAFIVYCIPYCVVITQKPFLFLLCFNSGMIQCVCLWLDFCFHFIILLFFSLSFGLFSLTVLLNTEAISRNQQHYNNHRNMFWCFTYLNMNYIVLKLLSVWSNLFDGKLKFYLMWSYIGRRCLEDIGTDF